MDKPLRKAIRQWAFPVLASAAALVAATGCGSAGSAQSGQIASIPSTASAGSTTTASSTAGAGSSASPPVERLDDSPAQIDALIGAWDDCLVAHGATYGNGAAVAGSRTLSNIPASAKAACLSKEPELPPQLVPSENPHYRADFISEVACMRAQGVMVHLVTDTSGGFNGLSWTYDNSNPLPADSNQVEAQCQAKAFSGKQ